MSRLVGGLRSVFEDVGGGVVALITAVLATAVGIVATLYLTGGTPYSQDDIDRATEMYELRSDSPAPPPAPPTDDADAAADEADLKAARKRALRLQRQADTLQERVTESEAEARRLRKALAKLAKAQQDAEEPDGATVPGADPEATEVVAVGTLATTWTLSSEAKPWPRACGVPASTYQVRVVGADGATVATGAVRPVEVVERKDKRGVLTLVCTLGYEVTVPLPTQETYEFQAVAVDKPKLPLYTALVQGTVVQTGAAPGLVVSIEE